MCTDDRLKMLSKIGNQYQPHIEADFPVLSTCSTTLPQPEPANVGRIYDLMLITVNCIERAHLIGSYFPRSTENSWNANEIIPKMAFCNIQASF